MLVLAGWTAPQHSLYPLCGKAPAPSFSNEVERPLLNSLRTGNEPRGGGLLGPTGAQSCPAPPGFPLPPFPSASGQLSRASRFPGGGLGTQAPENMGLAVKLPPVEPPELTAERWGLDPSPPSP